MPMVFPTSPTVGQVFSSGGRSWVWTGSTWDSPSPDNVLQVPIGLVPIIPTSVTTVSGSASINSSTGVITFTGASTVNVNGVFSAKYNHYKILHVSSGSSVNAQVGLQMRASGVNYTTANQRSHALYYGASGGPQNAGGSESATYLTIGWVQGSANTLNAINMDFYNPFNATQTTYTSNFTSYVSGTVGGGVPTTTQYDGFNVQVGAATYSGTMQIYGYN
jgi:hypothetical protein